MEFYHVISDIPKQAGERFLLDESHPNRVHQRVYEQIQTVEEILRDPDGHAGDELPHAVDVALRELAMEKVRREKYPQYPSRMAALYVSGTYGEAEQWGDYFTRIGRPVWGIAKIRVSGRIFEGDACNCFDGSVYEEENLRRAEHYWRNDPNEDGVNPIREILVDGDIEVIEIMKEINANIPAGR